jgi:YHS domain-containing protein
MKTVSCFVLCLLVSISAAAASQADPVNKSRGGIAIKGYDPVAYFADGRPVKGAREFSHAWMGATWYFSSARNRDLFAADPPAYAPQFGGYCSYAVSENYIYDADPEVWKIVDGKLYLNYNREAQQKWWKNVGERIPAGNWNWPGLHR